MRKIMLVLRDEFYVGNRRGSSVRNRPMSEEQPRSRIRRGHVPPERSLRACRAAVLVTLLLAACSSPKSSASPVTPSSPGLTSSPGVTSSPSPLPSPSPSPSPRPTPIPGAVPLCTNVMMRISLRSQTGAAGTIRSVWQAKNASNRSCRSFGYPGMDFHSSGRWLNVRVHRGGGHTDINSAPRHILVAPGHSLYYVSYWSDVDDLKAGSCRQFDRVKVTLPDNFSSAQLAQTGCVTTDSVQVGPVTTTPPTP